MKIIYTDPSLWWYAAICHVGTFFIEHILKVTLETCQRCVNFLLY
jgi:hypothetical protein